MSKDALLVEALALLEAEADAARALGLRAQLRRVALVAAVEADGRRALRAFLRHVRGRSAGEAAARFRLVGRGLLIRAVAAKVLERAAHVAQLSRGGGSAGAIWWRRCDLLRFCASTGEVASFTTIEADAGARAARFDLVRLGLLLGLDAVWAACRWV